MNREEATKEILAAKAAKGVTFDQNARALGSTKNRVTSALLGQSTMSREEPNKAVEALGLGPDVAAALQTISSRGSIGKDVPVDPLIYRFHEITQVYGTTLKAIIHEMFGDGIMSAIDFEMDVQKKEDPKGDRVVITMNGKFLPYKKW